MTSMWDEWTASLAGSEDEDLSQVLTHVRLQTLAETRTEWANDRRTRDFLNLGLHLLYINHIRGGSPKTAGEMLFKSLSPTALQDHAVATMIDDPDYAQSLDANRFKEAREEHRNGDWR